MDRLEAFTCRLYAPKSSSTKVNDLRYDIFCAKRGEIESHQLPLCRDCFVKHAQRANYQAQYGAAALNRTRKYQVMLVEDGRLRRKNELNSWWCIEWMDSHHLR